MLFASNSQGDCYLSTAARGSAGQSSPPGYNASPTNFVDPNTNSPTGYTPVSFDTPADVYGISVVPEVFYGTLIDDTGRPSEVFCRMCDALFFYMNSQCQPLFLRGTQHVEPEKYGWLMREFGAPPETVQVVEQHLQALYDAAAIPYKIVNLNGRSTPVLDRRGFLHLAVFDGRAAPEESHQYWSKALIQLLLRDPASGTLFPTPLPRGALPYCLDLQASSTYSNWRLQTMISASRATANAMIAQTLGSVRPFGTGLGTGASFVPPTGYGSSIPIGAGTNIGANPYLTQLQQMQQQSLAASQQQLNDIQAAQRRQSMINTATGLMQSFMGGGMSM